MMIRAMLDSPSVHLAVFVLLVCSAVCSLVSCYSIPDRLDCTSNFVEFDVRAVQGKRHLHCFASESDIERIDSHMSRQRRRPIVAFALALLVFVKALDLVRIHMALPLKLPPLEAMKQRNSDRHKQLRMAMLMSVVDVCPSCDGSGTKPDLRLKKRNK